MRSRARLAATGALVADLESAWLPNGAGGRALACVRVVAGDGSGQRNALWEHRRTRVALRTLSAVAAGFAEWTAQAPDGAPTGAVGWASSRQRS